VRNRQKDMSLRERECVHRPHGIPGDFYQGRDFVAPLYRLRGDAAVKVARKVQPFFWEDADLLGVRPYATARGRRGSSTLCGAGRRLKSKARMRRARQCAYAF
jgi:hypothetical protein